MLEQSQCSRTSYINCELLLQLMDIGKNEEKIDPSQCNNKGQSNQKSFSIEKYLPSFLLNSHHNTNNKSILSEFTFHKKTEGDLNVSSRNNSENFKIPINKKEENNKSISKLDGNYQSCVGMLDKFFSPKRYPSSKNILFSSLNCNNNNTNNNKNEQNGIYSQYNRSNNESFLKILDSNSNLPIFFSNYVGRNRGVSGVSSNTSTKLKYLKSNNSQSN